MSKLHAARSGVHGSSHVCHGAPVFVSSEENHLRTRIHEHHDENSAFAIATHQHRQRLVYTRWRCSTACLYGADQLRPLLEYLGHAPTPEHEQQHEQQKHTMPVKSHPPGESTLLFDRSPRASKLAQGTCSPDAVPHLSWQCLKHDGS
jgi:hypothetical protein